MSNTDGRRERTQRILKLLEKHPAGLNPHQIAHDTQLITEITMDRLHKYLAELKWADMLIDINGRYMLIPKTPLKTRKRERERK
jgi:DNA-binding IclR family transcriptional regulator